MDTTIDNLLIAAKSGDVEAQFKLGIEYMRDGKNKNLINAAYFLQLAANQGHLNAMNSLACLYLEDNLFKRNEKEAKILLTRASDNGLEKAKYNLSMLYMQSGGIDSAKKAVAIFEELTQKGNADAMCRLGQAYLFGDGGYKIDEERAIGLLKRAAEAGCVDAMYQLGMSYQFAGGVDNDDDLAEHYYRLATDKGDLNAAYHLAFLCDENLKEEEAERLYEMLLEKGCCYTQFDMAYKYHQGLGVEKDLNQAKRLYQLAAEQGEKEARNNLGVIYAQSGEKESLNEAKRLFRKCSKKNAIVKNNLAVLKQMLEGKNNVAHKFKLESDSSMKKKWRVLREKVLIPSIMLKGLESLVESK